MRAGLFWVHVLLGRLTDLSPGDWCLVALVALAGLVLVVHASL